MFVHSGDTGRNPSSLPIKGSATPLSGTLHDTGKFAKPALFINPFTIFFWNQLPLIPYLIYFSAPLSFVILFYIFIIMTNMVDVHISIGNITIIVYYGKY